MEIEDSSGPYRATKVWLDLVQLFVSGIPVKRHWRNFKVIENSFTGAEAVKWFHTSLLDCPESCGAYNVTRSKTVILLEKFLEAGIFESVSDGKDTKFRGTSDLYILSQSDCGLPKLPLALTSRNNNSNQGLATYVDDRYEPNLYGENNTATRSTSHKRLLNKSLSRSRSLEPMRSVSLTNQERGLPLQLTQSYPKSILRDQNGKPKFQFQANPIEPMCQSFCTLTRSGRTMHQAHHTQMFVGGNQNRTTLTKQPLQVCKYEPTAAANCIVPEKRRCGGRVIYHSGERSSVEILPNTRHLQSAVHTRPPFDYLQHVQRSSDGPARQQRPSNGASVGAANRSTERGPSSRSRPLPSLLFSFKPDRVQIPNNGIGATGSTNETHDLHTRSKSCRELSTAVDYRVDCNTTNGTSSSSGGRHSCVATHYVEGHKSSNEWDTGCGHGSDSPEHHIYLEPKATKPKCVSTSAYRHTLLYSSRDPEPREARTWSPSSAGDLARKESSAPTVSTPASRSKTGGRGSFSAEKAAANEANFPAKTVNTTHSQTRAVSTGKWYSLNPTRLPAANGVPAARDCASDTRAQPIDRSSGSAVHLPAANTGSSNPRTKTQQAPTREWSSISAARNTNRAQSRVRVQSSSNLSLTDRVQPITPTPELVSGQVFLKHDTEPTFGTTVCVPAARDCASDTRAQPIDRSSGSAVHLPAANTGSSNPRTKTQQAPTREWSSISAARNTNRAQSRVRVQSSSNLSLTDRVEPITPTPELVSGQVFLKHDTEPTFGTTGNWQQKAESGSYEGLRQQSIDLAPSTQPRKEKIGNKIASTVGSQQPNEILVAGGEEWNTAWKSVFRFRLEDLFPKSTDLLTTPLLMPVQWILPNVKEVNTDENPNLASLLENIFNHLKTLHVNNFPDGLLKSIVDYFVVLTPFYALSSDVYNLVYKGYLYLESQNNQVKRQMTTSKDRGTIHLSGNFLPCYETAFTTDSPITRVISKYSPDNLHHCDGKEEPVPRLPSRSKSVTTLPFARKNIRESLRSLSSIKHYKKMKASISHENLEVLPNLDYEFALTSLQKLMECSRKNVLETLSKSKECSDVKVDMSKWDSSMDAKSKENRWCFAYGGGSDGEEYIYEEKNLSGSQQSGENVKTTCNIWKYETNNPNTTMTSEHVYANVSKETLFVDPTSDGSDGYEAGDSDSDCGSFHTAASTSINTSRQSAKRPNHHGLVWASEVEGAAVQFFQLALLCIAPQKRSHLQQLLLAIRLVTQSPVHLTQDVHMLYNLLIPAGISFTIDPNLNQRMMNFMSSHYDQIFIVPHDLLQQVRSYALSLIEQHTASAKLSMPSFQHRSAMQQCISCTDAPAPVTYCKQVTSLQFEQQRQTGSQMALSELLEQILNDCKMRPKEKKKRLKSFKDAYPHIYFSRFPDDTDKIGKRNILKPVLIKFKNLRI